MVRHQQRGIALGVSVHVGDPRGSDQAVPVLHQSYVGDNENNQQTPEEVLSSHRYRFAR
jgi:hypothetical protein